MELSQAFDQCMELLLDVVCYEAIGGRLSPEMRGILDLHLRECSRCKNKTLGLLQLLHPEQVRRHYG